jgi:hypothetical protein
MAQQRQTKKYRRRHCVEDGFESQNGGRASLSSVAFVALLCLSDKQTQNTNERGRVTKNLKLCRRHLMRACSHEIFVSASSSTTIVFHVVRRHQTSTAQSYSRYYSYFVTTVSNQTLHSSNTPLHYNNANHPYAFRRRSFLRLGPGLCHQLESGTPCSGSRQDFSHSERFSCQQVQHSSPFFHNGSC